MSDTDDRPQADDDLTAAGATPPSAPSPRSVVYRLWTGVLPPEVCQAVIESFDPNELESTPIQRHDGTAAVDTNVRHADHTFIDPAHWTGAFVAHFAHEANFVWNLDVVGLGTLSFIRYVEGGHFDWHVDTLTYDRSPYRYPGVHERKLSVTINLSDPADYDGGDLEFRNAFGQTVAQGDARPQGSVVVFPSTVCHRVTPVTRGVRHVMVGWLVGPPLR